MKILDFQKVDSMKKIAVVLLAAVLFSSCAKISISGIKDTKLMEVSSSFSAIEVEGAIEVEFTDDHLVEIESDVNLLPYVEVYVSDEVLHVKYKDGVRIGDGYYSTYVGIPYVSNISSVTLSGASVFESDYPLAAVDFTLNASGASEMDAEVIAEKGTFNLSGASAVKGRYIIADKLYVLASGASKVMAQVLVSKCVAELSGASRISGTDNGSIGNETFNFNVGNFSGSLSGASGAFLTCSDGKISGTLSGASYIFYKGNAVVEIPNLADGSTVKKFD